MNFKCLSALLLTLSFASALSQPPPGMVIKPEAYILDVEHTKINFEVVHLAITSVNGNFLKFGGDFNFDPTNLEATSLKAWADSKSVFTDNKKRDDHIRSPDFFDSKKYPRIEFQSKSAKKTGEKTFQLTGDFTLKGKTKTVTFDCTFKGAIVAFGKHRVGLKATTVINRQDFGVSFSTLADSVPLVGDQVTIVINAEGILKSDL